MLERGLDAKIQKLRTALRDVSTCVALIPGFSPGAILGRPYGTGCVIPGRWRFFAFPVLKG
jgi:hypothetical protein